MTEHKVVGPEQWQAAREELLEREKVHTRIGDELARQRRELPWVAIDKPYRFDTDHGPASLAELFDDRSHLLVYHFMFGPSYQAGDLVNSSIADTLNALLPHLQARDVTPVLVSHAHSTSSRPTSPRWAGTLPGSRRSPATSTSTSAPPPSSSWARPSCSPGRAVPDRGPERARSGGGCNPRACVIHGRINHLEDTHEWLAA